MVAESAAVFDFRRHLAERASLLDPSSALDSQRQPTKLQTFRPAPVSGNTTCPTSLRFQASGRIEASGRKPYA